MADKIVFVGITGCIAAYKAANIVRQLKEKGLSVETAMTGNATQFVTPLTLQALSGARVIIDPYDMSLGPGIKHVALQEQAGLLLIAPASANMIGKCACGIADDFLSTLFLAFKGPVLMAPAMNEAMYLAASVQRNIKVLKQRGVQFVDPVVGRLATGIVAVGRMAPEEIIVRRCLALLWAGRPGRLDGRKVLVTAGATCEDIDAVRYLTNRSSGKMGCALAEAALDRGAEVTLIHGDMVRNLPAGARCIAVRSAKEMHRQAVRHFPGSHITLMAAAVADYTPATPLKGKHKKGAGPLSLELVRTGDILKTLGKRKKRGQIIVGFAAEDSDRLDEARRKLTEKNCDFVVANNILSPDGGFGSDHNAATLISRGGGAMSLPRMEKIDMAHRILDAVAVDKGGGSPRRKAPSRSRS